MTQKEIFRAAQRLGDQIRKAHEVLRQDPLGRSIFRAVLYDAFHESSARVDGPHPVDRDTPEGMGDL